MRSADEIVNRVQETILLSPVDLGLAVLTLLIFSMVFSVRKIVSAFSGESTRRTPHLGNG